MDQRQRSEIIIESSIIHDSMRGYYKQYYDIKLGNLEAIEVLSELYAH